ncbi:MAG: hypothetical protein J6S66_05345 [Bacteroidales bacterium]|nr:hypothetical protein [Bacteroidales bacterium]
MKKTLSMIFVVLGLLAGLPAFAQQQEKQPSMEELAAQEADRLGRLLDLEDWQIFYVDSTLQHDYVEMDNELKSMQSSKVSNTNLYYTVQDKWMEQIDKSLQKFFTEEQWAKYLKSGAARRQKDREKRREKAAKAAAKTKK